MSDKDLIRRGTAMRNIRNVLCEDDESYGNALWAIEDCPAVPHEMSAREFLCAWRRMCATHEIDCASCPLCTDDTGYLPCGQWITSHPNESVALVERWAREHPEKEE